HERERHRPVGCGLDPDAPRAAPAQVAQVELRATSGATEREAALGPRVREARGVERLASASDGDLERQATTQRERRGEGSGGGEQAGPRVTQHAASMEQRTPRLEG